MFKLLLPLPKQVCVALSGGVDSVAIVDFLSKNHDLSCAFYHHGTENSEAAYSFVSEFCTERNIPLFVGMLNKTKDKKLSDEEFWRNERYRFLESIHLPMVTGHNLNDCVETYLWSCLHGKPKVIPTTRNNIVRPFLTTKKQVFIDWCKRKNIDWCEDKSNANLKYTRNYIRHTMLPNALVVNPGLFNVVKRIVEKQI